jgi:hypothetical protein
MSDDIVRSKLLFTSIGKLKEKAANKIKKCMISLAMMEHHQKGANRWYPTRRAVKLKLQFK